MRKSCVLRTKSGRTQGNRPKDGIPVADEGTRFPTGTSSLQIWNSFPHCDEKDVHLWLLLGHYPERIPPARDSNAVWQACPRRQREKDVAKTMHNLSAQAQILGELGWVCMEWEDYTTASQYFAEALQHYQALQDDRCQCRMLRYLGVLSHRQQQLDAALDYYQQAWEIVKMNCDRVPFDDKWAFQAAELPNLTGCIYLDRQDFPSSHRDLTLSLENYRLLGQQWEKYRYYQADPLLNLGRLYFRQGDRDRARKYYQDCLQLCQDISRPDTMAGVLLHLATLAEAEHNYTEAVRLTSESERIAGTEIPALREQAARFKERLLTESADKFNSLG